MESVGDDTVGGGKVLKPYVLSYCLGGGILHLLSALYSLTKSIALAVFSFSVLYQVVCSTFIYSHVAMQAGLLAVYIIIYTYYVYI